MNFRCLEVFAWFLSILIFYYLLAAFPRNISSLCRASYYRPNLFQETHTAVTEERLDTCVRARVCMCRHAVCRRVIIIARPPINSKAILKIVKIQYYFMFIINISYVYIFYEILFYNFRCWFPFFSSKHNFFCNCISSHKIGLI